MESPLRSPLRYPQRYTYEKRRIYSERSETLFARMTLAPAEWHKRAIDLYLDALWRSGSWSLMDALYVMAAQDEAAATLNWISTSYGLTATGSPTFAAYRGYTPDGSTTFLDTGFNPTTAGGKFTLNSSHLAGWHLTNNINGAAHSYDLGSANSRIIRLSTGNTSCRPNNVTNQTVSGSFATHKVINRSGAAAWQFYTNASATQSGTTSSTVLTNTNFFIGTQDGTANFGVNQAAIVHFGSSLTAAQVASIHSASRAYLLTVGAIS